MLWLKPSGEGWSTTFSLLSLKVETPHFALFIIDENKRFKEEMQSRLLS